MENARAHWRKVRHLGFLVVTLLVNCCAGIQPYEPRDHREEGPETGLISGEAGEFVIFRRDQIAED